MYPLKICQVVSGAVILALASLPECQTSYLPKDFSVQTENYGRNPIQLLSYTHTYMLYIMCKEVFGARDL